MNDIVVCIPNYNGADYLRKLVLQKDLDYVVVDNCSTDDSVAICEQRGIKVIKNMETLDRVHNWIRCLIWFKHSDYQWLKWLFVGDRLDDNAGDIMRRAVASMDTASVVVFDYDVDYGDGDVRRWRSVPAGNVLTSEKMAICLLRKENIFGSPIGIMIKKDEFVISQLQHEFVWAADYFLHYKLAEHGLTYFVGAKIGTFNAKSRKHFQRLYGQLNSLLEELEILRIVYMRYPHVISEAEMMAIFIKKIMAIAIKISPSYTYLLKIYNRLLQRAVK